jgi:hypothetical protein
MDQFTTALIALSLVFLVSDLRHCSCRGCGVASGLFVWCGPGSVCRHISCRKHPVLLDLRTYNRLMYHGAALCGVLLIITAISMIFLIGRIGLRFSITSASQTSARIDQAALPGIAPCSVLFFIAPVLGLDRIGQGTWYIRRLKRNSAAHLKRTKRAWGDSNPRRPG